MTATVRGSDQAAKRKAKKKMYDGREEEAAVEPVDVAAAVAAVAEQHQDEMVGYGETAWFAAAMKVLYVCGDWTDTAPIDADYLAIDGVDSVTHEAEALPEGWWDAEVVYPADPPRWVTDRELSVELALQAEYESMLALARSPLPEDVE